MLPCCGNIDSHYPVVRRERFGAMGIHIPYEPWGAIWSYQEFPNHILAQHGCFFAGCWSQIRHPNMDTLPSPEVQFT